MTSLGPGQAQLLRTLKRFGVELVVVGGVAAQLHGWQGATNDLDIAVSIDDENVTCLNAALKALGAGPPLVGALGTVYETVHGRLEIVSVADGVGRYEDWARLASERAVEEELTIVVADPADIVRSKEAAGRSKDLAVLPQIKRDLIDAGALDPDGVEGPVAPPRSESGGPPQFLIDLLGPRPDSLPGRWDVVAQTVLEYRQRWDIAGDGLGEEPGDSQRASDRHRIEALIERLRNR